MKQKLIELIKNISLQKRAFLIHSLKYLDSNQIAYILKLDPDLIEQIRGLLDEESLKKILENYNSGSLAKQKTKSKFKPRGRFGNHAGYREDIKETVKSKTEANVARYLTAKYGRSSWEYEPVAFPLGLTTKTGRTKVYTPDFRIISSSGDFFLEIKPGFLPQARDKAKLKNFKKVYPNVNLIIVTYQNSLKVIEWAKKNDFEVWIIEDLKLFCEEKLIELE